MEKLNLPIISDSGLRAKRLSMDDYLKFVYFNLRYTFDKKTRRREQKLFAVREPFLLK